MYPDKTERLCKALAEKIKSSGLGRIDYIVSPALGGLIPGYEDRPSPGHTGNVGRAPGRRIQIAPVRASEGARVIVVRIS